MAVSAPHMQMEVQQRWKSAQEASKSRKEGVMAKASAAVSSVSEHQAIFEAEILREASDDEEEAMEEVAGIIGASDVQAMAAIGAEGVEARAARPRASVPSNREGNTIETLLSQLRHEPTDEAECAAKFMLYEGYG